MNDYEEFNDLKVIPDDKNPFCTLYELEDGSRFYIEPAFYTQLKGFREQFPDRYPEIIEEIKNTARRNHRVIFTSNFEYPQTVNDDYFIMEITDVTDRLRIYAEDKSRGSDYGD